MKQYNLLVIALLVSVCSFAVAPVTGTMHMCIGSTTSLSDATGGGTWSSSNPAVGTVGGLSGVVTGISAGTTTITYDVSGTYVTAVVTVDPFPAAITGQDSVCVGGAVTLSDATPGGTWSDPAYTAFATVGSTTGIVTAISAGSVVITYTSSAGCNVTKTVTIHANPVNIAGITFQFCPGDSANYFSTPGGGTWSSSATAIAAIGSSSGHVTAISAGLATIFYTLPTTCYIARQVTVNGCEAAVPQVNDEHAIAVYPSPATDDLYIDAAQNMYASFIITNQLGIVMRRAAIKQHTTVSVRSLPPGMYYVALHGSTGVTVRKILKL